MVKCVARGAPWHLQALMADLDSQRNTSVHTCCLLKNCKSKLNHLCVAYVPGLDEWQSFPHRLG